MPVSSVQSLSSVQFVSNSLRPHGLYSSWNSPGQHTGVDRLPSPGDLPNPGIKCRSPALQADSLPAESHGKPKKTGMGSLSLLQWIFPMQDKPAFPALQVDSLPTELSGKSKGTLNSQSFDCSFSSIFFSFTLSYLCLNFLWVFNSLLGEFSSLRLNSLCKLISTYDNLPSHFLICLF